MKLLKAWIGKDFLVIRVLISLEVGRSQSHRDKKGSTIAFPESAKTNAAAKHKYCRSMIKICAHKKRLSPSSLPPNIIELKVIQK